MARPTLDVNIPRLEPFGQVVNEMLEADPAISTVRRRLMDQNDQIDLAGTRRAAPLNPNQAFARGPMKSSVPRKSNKKRKQNSRRLKQSVLIVDDVTDVTEMIALFLKHAGYEVATADSAPAALKLANEKVFDVIISDIGMPEMNGYELAESLRTRAEYQGIPIIAVTGYSEYDDRGRALQSGFNAHLTKPIDPAELLKLMNELMG